MSLIKSLLNFKLVLKFDCIEISGDKINLKSPLEISNIFDLLNIFFIKISVLSAKKEKFVFLMNILQKFQLLNLLLFHEQYNFQSYFPY